jgi:hypothetical protein
MLRDEVAYILSVKLVRSVQLPKMRKQLDLMVA